MNIRLYLIVSCSLFFLNFHQSFSFLQMLPYNERAVSVRTGADSLASNSFKILKNRRIVLVTNQSGRLHNGMLTADSMVNAGIQIQRILTPEHGFYSVARAGEHVEEQEQFRGIPVVSLYGKLRKPTKEMLADADIVIFDVQDVGLRSYTFVSTMINVMEACAQWNKTLWILDRPNPLGGQIVDGNILEENIRSFVGIIPVPYVHGCTFGELALMANSEHWLKPISGNKFTECNIKVIPLTGWSRSMTWEETELPWSPPSPHMPTPDAARGAAVTGIFGEIGLMSIGIGYTLPFQMLGSPTLNLSKIERELQKRNLFDEQNGIRLLRVKYKPFYGMYSKSETACSGFVLSFIRSSSTMRPYTFGIELILAIRAAHPELFQNITIEQNAREMFKKVTGSSRLLEALYSKGNDNEIRSLISEGRDEFLELRRKYLLYE